MIFILQYGSNNRDNRDIIVSIVQIDICDQYQQICIFLTFRNPLLSRTLESPYHGLLWDYWFCLRSKRSIDM